MSQPSVLQSGRRDWVPIIITALTTLAGAGIFVSIYNSFISYVTAPNVQVVISSGGSKDNQNASILVKNTGGVAATHVRLMVKTPEEIIRYSNFSTENITLKKIEPKLLEGTIQRLVQGPGSLVNINLMIEAKPKINYTGDYAAFVTYDQGSNTGGFSLKPPEYMTYIIYFIIYIAASIFVIFYLRRLVYRRRVRELYNRLYEIEYVIYNILMQAPPRSSSRQNRVDQCLSSLNSLRMRANYHYTDGKLHKADYEYLVNKLEQEMGRVKELNMANEGWIEEEKMGRVAPTKSVYKMTRYTSEGKPIITDEK